MSRDNYKCKMRKITDLPQFVQYEKPRKNAKNPVIKEEERIIEILKKTKGGRKDRGRVI